MSTNTIYYNIDYLLFLNAVQYNSGIVNLTDKFQTHLKAARAEKWKPHCKNSIWEELFATTKFKTAQSRNKGGVESAEMASRMKINGIFSWTLRPRANNIHVIIKLAVYLILAVQPLHKITALAYLELLNKHWRAVQYWDVRQYSWNTRWRSYCDRHDSVDISWQLSPDSCGQLFQFHTEYITTDSHVLTASWQLGKLSNWLLETITPPISLWNAWRTSDTRHLKDKSNRTSL